MKLAEEVRRDTQVRTRARTHTHTHTHTALLTFDIQIERIALTVAFRVTGETGVESWDVPGDRLQHQSLIAQDDTRTRIVVKW